MTDDPASLTVVGHDETADGFEVERWSALAARTLADEGVERGRLDLIFVDPADMHELNREHMGVDRPTDVLAFPLDGADHDSGAEGGSASGDPSAPVHLGDVVVCPTVAREQAADHCGAYEPELSLLVIHGVLHVLGHDHAEPEETARMQGRERHHLERLGYAHPVPA